MKLLDRKLILRMVAAVADSLLFYIGFLFVNQIASGSRIHIIFFVITSLCGLFINFVPYNNSDKRKNALFFGSVGLAVTLVSVVISALGGFNYFTLPIGFAALMFLYYKSFSIYYAKINYVYTIRDLNVTLLLLFAINIIISITANLATIAEDVMRYTVLYLVIALYMLLSIKNLRYISKNENSNKSTFELVITILIMVLAVVMSIPEVFQAVSGPFVAGFKFLYQYIAQGIIYIMYPIAWALSYLFGKLGTANQGGRKKVGEGGDGSTKPRKLGDALENLDNPFIDFLGKALTFLVLIAICAFAIYLLYRVITRMTRTEEQEDFTEAKEFILKRDKKNNPGLFGKLAGSMKKVAGDIAFMFTADNKERLRRDYKNFIQKLHGKKVIEHYNYTAQDISKHLQNVAQNSQEALQQVTDMYEEVRYGVKYPEDSDLRSFRKNLEDILKNLQPSQ